MIGQKIGNMAGVEGIEPPMAVLETAALPLGYTPSNYAQAQFDLEITF